MIRLSPEDKREIVRWASCAAVVLACHGAAVAAFTLWPDPDIAGDVEGAITLDLAPVLTSPTQVKSDLPVAPPQEQSEAQQAKPVEKTEQPKEKPEEKPTTNTEAKIATAPEAAPTLGPKAAAPALVKGLNPSLMPTWKSLISAHLQRNKGTFTKAYGDRSATVLSFTIDRKGMIVSASIARSSGHPDLDQESLVMLRRAQPFPPPPAELAGATFPFTVPYRLTD